MRFIHLSDTHFDYSPAMNYIDMENYSKEKYDAFQRAIDYAKENNIKLIVHSGDVFDRINPKLSYVHELMKLLYEGTKDGITFLIISGNHDQPKVRDTFNPLSLYDGIDGIHIFTTPQIFTFENTDFFCIPSPREWSKFSDTFEGTLNNLIEKEKNVDNTKVLVTHIQIFDARDKSTDEIEPFIANGLSPDKIPRIFNYVALGHVHRFQQIADRPEMYYAGSLTPLSFNEIGQKKYFIDVDVEKNQETKIMPIESTVNYKLIEQKIDVEHITAEEDIENLVDYYTENIELENNILKIIFTNATDVFYREYDAQKLTSKMKKQNVLGFKVEIKRKEENLKEDFEKIDITSEDLIKPLSVELKDYFEMKKETDDEINKLLDLNNKILLR